jgi:hypothetical protein
LRDDASYRGSRALGRNPQVRPAGMHFSKMAV